MCVLKLKACVRKQKRVFVGKRRVWKLKESVAKQTFVSLVRENAADRAVCGVEELWSGLKRCLLDASDKVCGTVRGPPRHRETWWWDADVSNVVEAKRTAFVTWRKTGSAADREAYCVAKKTARRMIFAAQSRHSQSWLKTW